MAKRLPDETLDSVAIYVALLEAGKPLTINKLVRETGQAASALRNQVKNRAKAGLMVKDGKGKSATYDLTVTGFERVRDLLNELHVDADDWRRTAARIGVMG